eukprot:6189505-Pleurochrysis_carterae.AAC.3
MSCAKGSSSPGWVSRSAIIAAWMSSAADSTSCRITSPATAATRIAHVRLRRRRPQHARPVCIATGRRGCARTSRTGKRTPGAQQRGK